MATTVRSIFAALAAVTLLASPVLARPNSKMADCNKQSAGKTGDDRKSFMSQCLAAKPEAKAMTPQRQKMKDCNVQAKGMKGQERKDFMKTCLKK